MGGKLEKKHKKDNPNATKIPFPCCRVLIVFGYMTIMIRTKKKKKHFIIKRNEDLFLKSIPQN